MARGDADSGCFRSTAAVPVAARPNAVGWMWRRSASATDQAANRNAAVALDYRCPRTVPTGQTVAQRSRRRQAAPCRQASCMKFRHPSSSVGHGRPPCRPVLSAATVDVSDLCGRSAERAVDAGRGGRRRSCRGDAVPARTRSPDRAPHRRPAVVVGGPRAPAELARHLYIDEEASRGARPQVWLKGVA